MKAILTAEYKGQQQKDIIYGDDSLEIICGAINKILNKAKNDILWAKGKILLKDEQGNILREMAEKK